MGGAELDEADEEGEGAGYADADWERINSGGNPQRGFWRVGYETYRLCCSQSGHGSWKE